MPSPPSHTAKGDFEVHGASTGTLRSALRSPNWRLPSMRTVRLPSCPMATARLNAMVVLPTPPFGAKTLNRREVPPSSVAWNAVWTALTLLTRS